MDDGRQGTSAECPGGREREALIAELERPLAESDRRFAELERKLEQLTRDMQRQTARFPRPKVIPPDQHKCSGRKPGHDGALRAMRKKVHRTIHVPCATYPEFRVKLVQPQTRELYQTDVPPIEPQVTKFVVQSAKCPCCEKYRQGRHEEHPPRRTTSDVNNVLGPRVLGLAPLLTLITSVKGRCVAHILRRARGLTESDTRSKSKREHVENLITLLRRVGEVNVLAEDLTDRTGLRRLTVPQQRPTRRRAAPG